MPHKMTVTTRRRSRRVEPEPIVAAAALSKEELFDSLREVAEEHVPDSNTYGDTWWRESDATVFWNAADWSGIPEIEAAQDAFLAIDGVDNFEYDYECGSMEGDGYEKVWPEPRSTASVEEIVALANEPLFVEHEPTAEETFRDHLWEGSGFPADGHSRRQAAIIASLAERSRASETIALAAIGALAKAVSRAPSNV